MTAEELIERIQVELKMPGFRAYLDETKEYSEEDYQKFKADLLSYYDEYVDKIEGYCPGTDVAQNAKPEDDDFF